MHAFHCHLLNICQHLSICYNCPTCQIQADTCHLMLAYLPNTCWYLSIKCWHNCHAYADTCQFNVVICQSHAHTCQFVTTLLPAKHMLIPVNLILSSLMNACWYLPICYNCPTRQTYADTCQLITTVIPASSLPAPWDTEEPPLLEHELEAFEEKQGEKEWFRDEDDVTSSNRGRGTSAL
jgi:hypothetical protein